MAVAELPCGDHAVNSWRGSCTRKCLWQSAIPQPWLCLSAPRQSGLKSKGVPDLTDGHKTIVTGKASSSLEIFARWNRRHLVERCQSNWECLSWQTEKTKKRTHQMPWHVRFLKKALFPSLSVGGYIQMIIILGKKKINKSPMASLQLSRNMTQTRDLGDKIQWPLPLVTL